jgi:hypothetical protein
MTMRMLAACESSGRVRDAFAARGWDAWSCDLEPSESPGQHIQGDIFKVFGWPGPHWDLIIGFPPCTELSLAGARFWAQKRADGRQDAAAAFFMEMYRAPARHVAVENPRGDMSRRFRPPDQIVEPWWFGDPYAKKTCLWTRDLPELRADLPVDPLGRVATGGGSWRTDSAAKRTSMNRYEDSEGRKNRARVRSRTFPGFARAMAEQWGGYIEEVAAKWDSTSGRAVSASTSRWEAAGALAR